MARAPSGRTNSEEPQAAASTDAADMGALSRDETERLLAARAALEVLVSRFASLFLDAPVALITFNHRGMISELNRAAASLIGIPWDRPFRRKPFIVFVHAPDVRRFHQHLVNCRRNGSGHMELRLRRPDGEPRQVELVSKLAYSPSTNAPVYHTTLNDTDIGAERDRALAMSERRYREIVETADEGICIVDKQNDIVFANRRLGTMIGRPVNELVGTSAYDLLLEEDRSHSRDEFDHHQTPRHDVRLRRPDGTGLWVSVSTSLLRDETGRFTGMLRMYADASARHEFSESRHSLMRELIEAQERERARVARELHDEMGQHIVSLGLGVAKLARLNKGNDDANSVLAQLQETVDLLGRGVHTLAFQLRPAALDHFGLAVALANYGEHIAQLTGLEVDIHCDAQAVSLLSSTAQTALYRIAQEAMTNVVKHAKARHVTVILERRGAELVLIIEDDGVSFQPPQVGAPSSGVGIAGMRERTALLGGTLSIESSAGGGVTLYARVPITSSPVQSEYEQTPSAPR